MIFIDTKFKWHEWDDSLNNESVSENACCEIQKGVIKMKKKQTTLKF